MKSSQFLEQRFAFTVIELLVVVSIIAIIAVISVPVFSRASEGGKTVTNINNLRSMARAQLTYAADRNGALPATTQNIRVSGKAAEGLFLTTGLDLWPTGGPRRLFSKDKWVFGTGTSDFLDSPDIFYGPFTPILNKSRKKGELYERVATAYRIGYVFYFLPEVDDSDKSTSGQQRKATPDLTGRPICNSNLLTGHPKAPLFSDMISEQWAEETGYPWTSRREINVVYLDGSVSSIPAERVRTSKENKVFTMAGFVR